MKLLILVALLATFLSATHGGLPEGKNLKTRLNNMSWLEKMLTVKSQPRKSLNELMALDSKTENDNTIQDDYIGWVELYNVEFPLLLLQLVKMGDDILLPTFHWEYQWWFCVFDICDGFLQIYDFRNARMKTVTTTSLHASMNGTQIRVEFKVPDMEIQCPECTYDYTDYGQEPPVTSEYTFYRGYSMFVKNYSLTMTGDLRWNFDRIDINNVDLTWEMDEWWERQWNATHTYPNGTQEEWGPSDDISHERLLEQWANGVEDDAEEKIKYWLNCYLSNGKNNRGNCSRFFDEPLFNVTAAEILHGFGLAALNNHRASQPDLSSEFNLNAADPIETMNSVIFDLITHVMQTSKYAAAWYEPFPLQRAFTFVHNTEICSDNSTGDAVCETFQEQVTIGSASYTTELTGAVNNRASLTFDTTTVTYSFHVPDLTLSSSDFQRLLTNLNTGDQQSFSGLNLNVFDCTLGFVAEYGLEDGHFAISNMKMLLSLDKVTMDISDVSASEGGEWTNLPSIHKDAAPMVMELWESKDQDGVSLQERYQTFVQDKINDFLAGRITL